LLFDERIDPPAPHDQPDLVRRFVRESLRTYIAAHPSDISKPDPPSRRVPLNFPRPQEPPARSADEWVDRKAARAENLLWQRACAYCHQIEWPAGSPAAASARGSGPLPRVVPVGLRKVWMGKARFRHAPHLLLECGSCHDARASRASADVL